MRSKQANKVPESIVAKYHELLAADPDLTKQLAAINALIAALNTVPSTTAHETLEVIKAHTDRLKGSVRNPIPLAAGTDLFTQYIMTSLKQQDGSFEAVRQHLLRNGRLFAQRAAEARHGVAEAGWRFVTEGSTVFIHGASRCVIGLLERAAKVRGTKFDVVYIREETRADESDRVVKELRGLGIPTAEIDLASVAHVMSDRGKRAMIMVGAEVVMQSGGIISRMGTFGLARLAKSFNIPFYPCVETHKFSRRHLTDQIRWVGVKQDVLDFTTDKPSQRYQDLVDYTVSVVDRVYDEII